jgi:hypothetical protein
MRTEVANLIEGVPGWDLDQDFIVDIRDGHGDMKQVLLRMRERNFITNSGL